MSGGKEVQGASAEAIQAHYDVGNEFYALWLDETLTYSSALWDSAEDQRPLAWAQHNKIAWHLRSAQVEKAKRVLGYRPEYNLDDLGFTFAEPFDVKQE